MVFASRIACLQFLLLVIQAASQLPWLLRSCCQLPHRCSGKKEWDPSLGGWGASMLASSWGGAVKSDPTLGRGAQNLDPGTYIFIYIQCAAQSATVAISFRKVCWSQNLSFRDQLNPSWRSFESSLACFFRLRGRVQWFLVILGTPGRPWGHCRDFSNLYDFGSGSATKKPFHFDTKSVPNDEFLAVHLLSICWLLNFITFFCFGHHLGSIWHGFWGAWRPWKSS